MKSNHLLGSVLILDKLSLTQHALGWGKEAFTAVCNGGKILHSTLVGTDEVWTVTGIKELLTKLAYKSQICCCFFTLFKCLLGI